MTSDHIPYPRAIPLLLAMPLASWALLVGLIVWGWP